MLRLLIITDFTESFPTKLLQGIVKYSRLKEQWVVCRMPPSYKNRIGIPGVVKWAKDWGADAVVGQFEETDDVSLFAKNGIVAVAQDFKKRFTSIPNITGDYLGTGRMAARFFIEHGFRNFGFFGFNDVCWSDERCEGFREVVEEAGFGDSFGSWGLLPGASPSEMPFSPPARLCLSCLLPPRLGALSHFPRCTTEKLVSCSRSRNLGTC